MLRRESHYKIADAPLTQAASAVLSPLHAGPQSPTHNRVRVINPAPQVALHAPHALQADQSRGLPAEGGEQEEHPTEFPTLLRVVDNQHQLI
jgi:hypothetical protein